MSEVTTGQIVYSTAGRDCGRYFLVFKVLEDGYVSLVDGSLRKVEKPKRKKIKHLKALDIVARELAASSEAWTNSMVVSVLEALVGKLSVESERTAEEG